MKTSKLLALSLCLLGSSVEAASCWETFVSYVTCGCLDGGRGARLRAEAAEIDAAAARERDEAYRAAAGRVDAVGARMRRSSAVRSAAAEYSPAAAEELLRQFKQFDEARMRMTKASEGEVVTGGAAAASSASLREGVSSVRPVDKEDSNEFANLLQTGIDALEGSCFVDITQLARGEAAYEATRLYESVEEMKRLYAQVHFDKVHYLKEYSVERLQAYFIHMLSITLEANLDNPANLRKVTLATLKLLNLHKQKGIYACLNKVGYLS